MSATKQKKKEIIKDLCEKIGRQRAIIFADFAGLKVKDLAVLRKRLAEVASEFKVAKKTLIKIAFNDKKISVDTKALKGEVALVLGYSDQATPAKILYEFSGENPNIKILGGYLENQLLGADQVIALAKLPTKHQLLENFVGSLSNPLRNFASVLQANTKGLIIVLAKAGKK